MRRVRVWSGDGRAALGDGELVDFVTVQAWYTPNGALQSLTDAEQAPDADLLHKLAVAGATLVEIPHNPKIRLDDGRIVYGCQVWWEDLAPQASAAIDAHLAAGGSEPE